MYYFQRPVLNYSPSGKVVWLHGESGISIMRFGTCQLYHLNLLKRSNEVTQVKLATAASAEDDLGPEVAIPVNPLMLVPWSDNLSPDLAKFQANFGDVFLPLPGRMDLVQNHIKMVPVGRNRRVSQQRGEHEMDSSVCFCVDYRKVNSAMEFNAYPMALVGFGFI